jgi:hypothetical protein
MSPLLFEFPLLAVSSLQGRTMLPRQDKRGLMKLLKGGNRTFNERWRARMDRNRVEN